MIFTGGADGKGKAWSPDGKLIHSVDAHDGAVTVILYRADKPAGEEKKAESK